MLEMGSWEEGMAPTGVDDLEKLADGKHHPGRADELAGSEDETEVEVWKSEPAGGASGKLMGVGVKNEVIERSGVGGGPAPTACGGCSTPLSEGTRDDEEADISTGG